MKKAYFELKEGEYECSECNGTGKAGIPYLCPRCQGAGKLDWIENIVGKPPKDDYGSSSVSYCSFSCSSVSVSSSRNTTVIPSIPKHYTPPKRKKKKTLPKFRIRWPTIRKK